MKTVILSLQDAVETGLKDIDLLEKQDKVIFVYLKGKDNITIGVHNALAQLKCKTEFYEIPDEAATKADMPMYFAYLAGSNPGAAIIDTGSTFLKLCYLNILRYPDFKSIVSGKAVRKPKETGSVDQPVRKRKSRTVETYTKQDLPETIPMNPPVKDPEPVIEPVDKTEKKTAKKSKADAGKDINDLKTFLKSCATEECDPSLTTMSIFEAVKKNVVDGVPMDKALEETIIIEAKIQKINSALRGKWSKVADLVRDILQQKEDKTC